MTLLSCSRWARLVRRIHVRRRSFVLPGLLLVHCLLTLSTPSALAQRDATRRATAAGTGEPAPQFEATDDTGQTWKLSDHVGEKVVVLFFYPADFSPTVETQASRFNDELEELKDRGVELVGISGDSVANHQRFRAERGLNFALLSDEDGAVARKFGITVRAGGSLRDRSSQETYRRKITLAWRYIAIDQAGKIAFNQPRLRSLTEIDVVFDLLAKDFWANRSDKQAVWIPTLDSQWKRLLDREQYLVTRRSYTERPFTGEYWDAKKEGLYRCVGCGQVLFDSSTKFKSGTGWPSFWNYVTRESITFAQDRSHGQVRVEVKCSRCDAHLGHVFGDGPAPTGQRYCINSAALVLDPKRNE